MNPAPQQLSLGVSLREDTTFTNFCTSSANALACGMLQKMAHGGGEPIVTLWGETGCGLSHLLQAVCHEAGPRGALYLPLTELKRFRPAEVLDDLEHMALVCLDNLEAVAGQREWEDHLFHFYNRIKDGGRQLLMASSVSPQTLPWLLPDLKSRVLGSVIFHIQALNDEQLAGCLQARAAARGMHLSDEVTSYILQRVRRDAHHLFRLLDQLDEASLQQQRRLTVPFVKSLLQV